MQKIGVNAPSLTREHIQQYQLHKLRQVIRSAREHSPFYRRLFKGLAARDLGRLSDLGCFPFTSAADIRQQGLQFLTVSQGEISRVVTMDTSGTAGQPKRLYFTPSDQELTVDFFQQGMSGLVTSGQKVLVLLPGERNGSVGSLLAAALNRLGAEPVLHGAVTNLPDTLALMMRQQADSLVGIPAQVLALAHYGENKGYSVRLKSLLLSTDHVPAAVSRELERIWGCRVFQHYGMTEMGLGGGLDCEAHAGYHLREADLYFEIIDPLTGESVPAGQEGEVVFTTLTRQGMPLIRYRTGDLSRFLTEPCPCGTVLRRLEPIAARTGSRILTAGNRSFSLADLDEALFDLPGLIGFTAAVDDRQRAAKLRITAMTAGQDREAAKRSIEAALRQVPAICGSRRDRTLKVTMEISLQGDTLFPGTAKRIIRELNQSDGSQDDLSLPARENSIGG
nr:AMP-binding protein [Acetonema longum]